MPPLIDPLSCCYKKIKALSLFYKVSFRVRLVGMKIGEIEIKERIIFSSVSLFVNREFFLQIKGDKI